MEGGAAAGGAKPQNPGPPGPASRVLTLDSILIMGLSRGLRIFN